jgi:pyruvate formate lyase activating enzyme
MRIGYIKEVEEGMERGQRFVEVYTKGCNLRCVYCSYAELLGSCDGPDDLEWEAVRSHLEEHLDAIDGVVFTGGEPTLQEDLEQRIHEVIAMGLQVKLETNGTQPEVLRQLLTRNLLKHIAMDVKAPLENYTAVVGCKADTEAVRASVWIIKQSGCAHEFRTTVVPGLHIARELKAIAELIHGADCFVVQDFVSENPLRKDLRGRPAFPHKPLEDIRSFIERRVGRYEIRHSAAAKPMPLLRRRTRTAVVGC